MFSTSLHVWLKLTARKFLFPKICVVLCKVNNQQHALFRGGKILKAPALCALWLEYYADHSHISAPWPRMNNVASLISIKLINFCTGHCFAKPSHEFNQKSNVCTSCSFDERHLWWKLRVFGVPSLESKLYWKTNFVGN